MLRKGFQTSYDSMISNTPRKVQNESTNKTQEKEVIDLCSFSSSEEDEQNEAEQDDQSQENDSDVHSRLSFALLPKSHEARYETTIQKVEPSSTPVTSSSVSSSLTMEEKNKISSNTALFSLTKEIPSASTNSNFAITEERFDIISPLLHTNQNLDSIDDICAAIDREVHQYKKQSSSRFNLNIPMTFDTKNVILEYCWSCETHLYPEQGDLICEHPLLR